MLTRQEIFNKVIAGFASQGFAKSSNGIECRYRMEDGRRCAAGWLIPDESYRSSMEGKGADSGFVVPALVDAGIGEEELDFVIELQRAHDTSAGYELKAAMTSFAERHGLELPEALR